MSTCVLFSKFQALWYPESLPFYQFFANCHFCGASAHIGSVNVHMNEIIRNFSIVCCSSMCILHLLSQIMGLLYCTKANLLVLCAFITNLDCVSHFIHNNEISNPWASALSLFISKDEASLYVVIDRADLKCSHEGEAIKKNCPCSLMPIYCGVIQVFTLFSQDEVTEVHRADSRAHWSCR